MCVRVCVYMCAHIHVGHLQVHIVVNLQEVSQLSSTIFDSKLHYSHYLHLHLQSFFSQSTRTNTHKIQSRSSVGRDMGDFLGFPIGFSYDRFVIVGRLRV